MAEEKFDVIIVGGGIAGCIAGYLLAKDGLEVLIIERGNTIGAKNTSGGRIYAHSIEPIFPDFSNIAPIERLITHEKLSFMSEDENLTMDYTLKPTENKMELSYSVLRVKFDEWLGEQAENAGASIITGIRVDDLIQRDNKICGVIAGGEEMEADVVILADGANSTLCSKYGLGYELNPHTCAVGVKEIIELGKDRIEDIFNVNENEGAAWLFAGSPSAGHMGGGFLYTNKTSISLGVVFGLHNSHNSNVTVPEMLENFKNHPSVKPLIKNGKTTEYSAHIVPEGGLGAIKKISDNGVLVVGDCAGLCLNVGYSVRGMDLAVESAVCAAKAIVKAKQNNDFSVASLSEYNKKLNDSFVMKDLSLYKNLPNVLSNDRIFNEYPKMVNGIMRDLFVVNGASLPLRNKILPRLKEVGYFNIIKDVFSGVKSI
ncbi:FAD-dependent oxidoreductase [Campylobacter pinnipediorum]|uniref:Oxidoreductase n=1 Tax=Campylobacter pinnipediorum subsp. pinnipediorum TaxID=1660067 RepID=A0AAX0L8U6_9BACT|nr:FAD-dependent oxidoreductase [Campylobacter pinnipediorum]OPA74463.1 oxidoreductase [Campylobacter pinnipediorum subsp. pinnipediorum]